MRSSNTFQYPPKYSRKSCPLDACSFILPREGGNEPAEVYMPGNPSLPVPVSPSTPELRTSANAVVSVVVSVVIERECGDLDHLLCTLRRGEAVT